MSEPLQLIGRFQVASANLREFQARKIEPATQYTDWDFWLGAQRWHGSDSYKDIVSAGASGVPFEEWFQNYFREDEFGNYHAPVFNSFDEHLGLWTFMIFGFSQNYIEFLSAANALRQLDSISDRSTQGQCAIVPYAFGQGFSDVEVVITVSNGISCLDKPAEKLFTEWAVAQLANSVDQV